MTKFLAIMPFAFIVFLFMSSEQSVSVRRNLKYLQLSLFAIQMTAFVVLLFG